MTNRRSENPSHQSTRSQFDLLKKLRFAPFFWTQCCGAFNDNLFKTALAILLAYAAASPDGTAPKLPR